MTQSTHDPYADYRELTLRGMILGALITVIFTASNVYLGLCKPPPPFALCYINFCTRYVLKVASAFAPYRIAENKKSDGNVAFVFTSYK